MNPFLRNALPFVLLSSAAAAAFGQQLEAEFSCSTERMDGGEKVTYADNGEIRIKGNRVEAFWWESALFRSTHGFDCSINEEDGLAAEVTNDTQWRVSLRDAQAARKRRGYDFDQGMDCSIGLVRAGDTLNLTPTCPALCGSRNNFSTLSVNLKTGQCRYEE